jgi:putative transcriptional regulator
MRIRAGFAIVLFAVCANCLADSDLSRGKFLIATRQLNDPRFSQSVILLIRYDTEGSAGLILNLPTKIPASKAFPGATGFTEKDLLYLGGPVDKNQFCLLIQEWAAPSGEEIKVFDNVYVASNEAAIKKAVVNRKTTERLRFYVGYAGWSPGQLELEIHGGNWLVYRGTADSVYDSNPTHLWEDLLNKASLMQAAGTTPATQRAR